MSNQYRKITINDCNELAKSKNGKCLSSIYINANKPLMWECEFGHAFSLAWKHIQYYKSWCNQCNSNIGEGICRLYLEAIFGKPFVKIRPAWLKHSKYNLELDGYCHELAIAFEHNGVQHNTNVPYFHRDGSSLNKQKSRDLFKANKCRELGVKLMIIPEIFREIKLKDLGEFLVKECERLRISLPASINNIHVDMSKLQGGFDRLGYYKDLASERYGKCLSDAYINFHEPLVWQCEHGHTWSAVGYSIENGSWCPSCCGLKKLTLDDAKFVASNRGGFCLSDEYVSANKKLRWKCKSGHEWLATMHSVRNIGTWCPHCHEKQCKITERVSL
jgi:hypothetical protein